MLRYCGRIGDENVFFIILLKTNIALQLLTMFSSIHKRTVHDGKAASGTFKSLLQLIYTFYELFTNMVKLYAVHAELKL